MICSICGEQYEGWGNNAEPINDGQCCDKCNATVVLPRRVVDMVSEGRTLMKTYLGERDPKTRECRVWIVCDGEAEPLPWRLDLANHSPTGFEWGYAGSGPAQLALAILVDATGDDLLALPLHQRFKFERITTLRRDVGWSMTHESVLAFVQLIMLFMTRVPKPWCVGGFAGGPPVSIHRSMSRSADGFDQSTRTRPPGTDNAPY